MYINDFYNGTCNVSLVSLADLSVLVNKDKNIDDMHKKVEEDLVQIQEFLLNNGLLFNISKIEWNLIEILYSQYNERS